MQSKVASDVNDPSLDDGFLATPQRLLRRALLESAARGVFFMALELDKVRVRG